MNVEEMQVALATDHRREMCPRCLTFPHWWIPYNLIGVVCENCGAWCLVKGDKR